MSLEEKMRRIRLQEKSRREKLQGGPISEALAQVKHKIAIMSGKGGVGKTSLTISLAEVVQQKGYRVGIFDADVHGPSVPRMLGIQGGPDLMSGAWHLAPLTSRDGIKVMSVAFIWPGETTPAIWRGSYKMKAIRQLLNAVVWEQLDFLFIDLPPGTGDEVITIMESIPELDGVLLVTTPQKVATAICGKAVNTARELDVPVLGVVENMGRMYCPHCGQEISLFGEKGGEEFARAMEVPFLGSIPFDSRVRQMGDEGISMLSQYPDAEAVGAIRLIAEKMLSIVKSEGQADRYRSYRK
jgi:Mrp family chromosome partitioning ATPase